MLTKVTYPDFTLKKSQFHNQPDQGPTFHPQRQSKHAIMSLLFCPPARLHAPQRYRTPPSSVNQKTKKNMKLKFHLIDSVCQLE